MSNLNSVKFAERETGDVIILWSEQQEIPSLKSIIKHNVCLLWLSTTSTVIYFCSEQAEIYFACAWFETKLRSRAKLKEIMLLSSFFSRQMLGY